MPEIESRTGEYIPSFSEVDEILKHLPPHLNRLCFAATRLAYRKCELLGLKFEMIAWNEKHIQLPPSLRKGEKTKGRYSRPLFTPLYSEIYDFLKQLHKEAQEFFGRDNVNDVYIFRDKNGKDPIKGRNTKHYWDIACVKARCTEINDSGKTVAKYHFHDLRKVGIKYLRLKVGFTDREMIRKMYSGHKNKEVFDSIYDIVTNEDTLHWKKIALAS